MALPTFSIPYYSIVSLLSYLHGFLHVFTVVFLDVVVGSDWMFQFVIYHHTGSLGARPSAEQHDAGPGVRVRTLGDHSGGSRTRLQTLSQSHTDSIHAVEHRKSLHL